MRGKSASIISMALGLALLAGVAGYVIFASLSRSYYDNYRISVSQDDRLSGWTPNDPGKANEGASSVVDDNGTDTDSKIQQFMSLYPGLSTNPKYWGNPGSAGSEPFSAPQLPEGYIPVSYPGMSLQSSGFEIPIRLRIPMINLDAVVEELKIITSSGQQRYENPDQIVGHIPETADPGENATGWYFGHQSGFGTNEGAVFAHVPEIYDLLKQDPIYVFIDTANKSYAYRFFETNVEPREELTLTTTRTSTVTLVASWPPFVFDQRFLATAELVGIAEKYQPDN